MKPKTQLKAKHRRVQREHQAIYDVAIGIRDLAVKGEISNEDSVDIAFLLRSIAEYFDDLRRETDKIRIIIEKITCMRWMQSSLNEDPSKVTQTIQGELASGTPHLKTGAAIPNRNKDPEAHIEFMRQIGVSGEALRRNMVRVHWPLVIDYFTDLTERGLPLPKGIDTSRTYTLYSLRLRERKENENG